MALFAFEGWAAETVPGKRAFELEAGSRYSSAREVCEAAAAARRAERTVDDPYGRVVGSRDDDTSVWCEFSDSKGNKTDQHYGSVVLDCPAHSQAGGDGASCACDDGFRAASNQCLEKSSAEKQPAEIQPARNTERTPPPNVIESRNASLSAFGRQPDTYRDQFDGTVKNITSSRKKGQAANSAEGAAITEAQEYSRLVHEEKRVGIQSPGRVNEGGPDFIVLNQTTTKIEIYDTKLRGPGGSFPKAKTVAQLIQMWEGEVDSAINGWREANGSWAGGVDTGNRDLDQKIKQAWQEKDGKGVRVNVEAHQINVRGPRLPKYAEHKSGPL